MYSTVRQLVMAHGLGIDSIQIEYDKKGTSVWSEKHGGNGGNKVDKVSSKFIICDFVYFATVPIALGFF